VLTPIVNTSSQTPALKHSTMLSKPSRHASNANSFVEHSTRDNTVSVPTSPIDEDDDRSVSNSFRIGVIIHRATAGFTTRVNTIPSFLEINRRVSTYLPVPISLIIVILLCNSFSLVLHTLCPRTLKIGH
jgi:translation initiation factor eIF-2B subunit gamma